MSTSKVHFSIPGHRSPGVGCEAPFEMLEACHERVQRMLALLSRARVYGKVHGCDESFINAINDVVRYFESAAPQHHLDEERHVFPIILKLNNYDLSETVIRLKKEHRRMKILWTSLRVIFSLVTKFKPQKPVFSTEENFLIDEFISIYEIHILVEERKIYPESIKRITDGELSDMSLDMMQRRGIK